MDLIIPRGGDGLKAALAQVAEVPILYAASGNCHVYVDAAADLDMARRIAINAKVQKPSVCNSAETLLVHRDVAEALPARGAGRAAGGRGRAGRRRARRGARPAEVEIGEATQEDWDTEYHALKMAVGVVDSIEEAVARVNRHGSGHSEAIVTGSEEAADDVHERRRRCLRVRQRLDTLHRRLRLRHGRRDRQLDPEAARARPDRPARADLHQVRAARVGSDPRVSGSNGGVGVLGGAFNPPHIAHLLLAEEAIDSLGLDELILVPTGEAPHKRISPEPGPGVRLEMARLAARGEDGLTVSDVEVGRDGPSFAFRTLELLADERPGSQLTFVMGADVAAGLEGWRNPERVLELARVAIAERPGFDRSEADEALERLGARERAASIEMPAVGRLLLDGPGAGGGGADDPLAGARRRSSELIRERGLYGAGARA